MTLAVGGSALGALVGGSIARWIGITGPFWMSAVMMAVLMGVAWRPFGRPLLPCDANRREDGHDGRHDSQAPVAR